MEREAEEQQKVFFLAGNFQTRSRFRNKKGTKRFKLHTWNGRAATQTRTHKERQPKKKEREKGKGGRAYRYKNKRVL